VRPRGVGYADNCESFRNQVQARVDLGPVMVM
jgi:hypothetical protein